MSAIFTESIAMTNLPVHFFWWPNMKLTRGRPHERIHANRGRGKLRVTYKPTNQTH